MNRTSLVRLSAALLLLALALCACARQPAPTMTTSAGDLTLRRTWFSDRFPPDCRDNAAGCARAMSGYHVLCASFEPTLGDDLLAPDSGFSRLRLEGYVESSSGAKTDQYGVSVDQSHVVLAFVTALNESGFKLCWPGNPCFDLGK